MVKVVEKINNDRYFKEFRPRKKRKKKLGHVTNTRDEGTITISICCGPTPQNKNFIIY
jgi:hypothetical protein